MKQEPRITPSKLGCLCDPRGCRACWWSLANMNFQKPYDFGTPYIMQLLDQRQKQIARMALQRDEQLPEFFGPFTSATRLLNVKSFSAYHRETNLHLYGMPDLVFENADGTRMIVDNKTAFPKSKSDSLFYKYQAQLNFYGFLCENAAEAYPVTRVGLLYFVYEPVPDEEVLDTVGWSTISVNFTPTLVEVEYNPKQIILPLLQEVRELLDLEEPPAPAAGCKDCKKIKGFSKLFETDDLHYLRKVLTDQEWSQHLAKKRLQDATGSKPNVQESFELLMQSATPGGVLATWDFSPELNNVG